LAAAITRFTSFAAGGSDVPVEREQRTGRSWHDGQLPNAACEVVRKRAAAAPTSKKKSFIGGRVGV
jgi:hypothetical protein